MATRKKAKAKAKVSKPKAKKQSVSTKAKKSPGKKKKKLAQVDLMAMDGMKVSSAADREVAAGDASKHPLFARVMAEVLDAFRDNFPSDDEESDEEILETDPNDFDMDPSPFYEYLEARFGVEQDEENDYFGGYGGAVRDTIAFLTPRWDGKLRKV